MKSCSNRTPSKLRVTIDRLPLCGKKCSALSQSMLIAFLIAYVLYQHHLLGLALRQWDLLLISGVLTFFVGLRFAVSMPRRFHLTLARLTRRGVVRLGRRTLAEFRGELDLDADTWARVTGLIAALAMIGAFAIALTQNYTHQRAGLGLLEAVGAYVAGVFLGRTAFYGQLGWVLKRSLRANAITLCIDPTHVDSVSGLRPVGQYYFVQAMVVGIPAFFLAAWWFAIPVWPRDYSHWHDPYLALLAVAITIEFMAFLVPLWSFHRLMADKKRDLLEEADKISVEITTLRTEIAHAPAEEEANAQKQRVEVLGEGYLAIENMATWPVDIKTRRRLGLNNVLLLLPLVVKSVQGTVNWEEIAEALSKFQL